MTAPPRRPAPAGRPKVIVCGTKFGQVYLQAFTDPALPFELAGILGQGSQRSQAIAEHHRVPLFTSVEQLPDDIDIACVIVRGGLLGGAGVELACQLMERGIHVLQEHPLHGDELARCLKTARRHQVVHHLTTFYPYLAPVRRFLAAAARLRERQQPLYLDAACGFQVAFALFDILAQAVGAAQPWAFGELAPLPERVTARLRPGLDVPFRSLDGVLGGVPLTLRVHNQLDPADPDNYAHLMHRITLGAEGGALTLVATHGPTVWNPRPDFPRAVRESDARPHFAPSAPGQRRDHLDVPSTALVDDAEPPGFRRAFEVSWPAGVARALGELWAAANAPRSPARGQYYLGLCEIWQEVTLRLGPPELVHAQPPRPLGPAEVDALAAAAGGER